MRNEIKFTNDKILDKQIKDEIKSLADDFNNDIITEGDVEDVLMAFELSHKLDYEELYKFFKSKAIKFQKL